MLAVKILSYTIIVLSSMLHNSTLAVLVPRCLYLGLSHLFALLNILGMFIHFPVYTSCADGLVAQCVNNTEGCSPESCICHLALQACSHCNVN